MVRRCKKMSWLQTDSNKDREIFKREYIYRAKILTWLSCRPQAANDLQQTSTVVQQMRRSEQMLKCSKSTDIGSASVHEE